MDGVTAILASGAGVQAVLAVGTVPVEVAEPWVSLLLSPGARVLAFVWGLLWGSFTNVLIYRLPLGMSVVHPRSRCPSCETPIAAYDNVPVFSYLILRGKCRHCGAPMRLRYLVVELLVGVLSFATFMMHVHVPLLAGGAPNVLGWLLWFVFGTALLAITYIDLEHWIIPNAIVVPLAAVGVGVSVVAPAVLGVDPVDAVGAAAGGYLLFAGIRWFYLRFRGIEGLGLGDAKLLLMVGAFTGLRGLLWCISFGALQGLLVSVPLLLMGRNVAQTDLQEVHGDDPELGEEDPSAGVMGRRVPFGPFLALAGLEYVLLRPQIEVWIDWAIRG